MSADNHDYHGYFDANWLQADPSSDELKDAVSLRKWKLPGPVSEAYLHSREQVKALVGPYGSGKTTSCQQGEVLEAIRSPQCLDGVRRYSCLMLRDNYRQLYGTTVKTWHQWYPPEVGAWKGGNDRPGEHKLTFRDEFGLVKMHVMFAAIPELDIESWLDGFEISSVFLNAAPTMPKEVLTYALGRVGRDPPQRLLPKGCAIYKHVAIDANKTEDDHWFYELCESGLENGDGGYTPIGYFEQPGGRDPGAENIENLTPGYYDDLVKRQPKWWVRIKIDNKWGPSRHGTPVYEDFEPELHTAKEDLAAVPGLPLILMMDAGTATAGHPSCLIGQIHAGPQVRILGEVYKGRCGPGRFMEAVLHELEQPYLKGPNSLEAWLDPSAFGLEDQESGESTWLSVAELALGITIGRPISNALHDFRIPSVQALLNQRNGLLVSRRCKLLIKGFNSAYHYEKQNTKSGTTEKPMPAKNDASHPHDALQHGVTGHFGMTLIEGAMRQRKAAASGTPDQGSSLIDNDFDVMGI